eukprot:gene15439-18312_t
MLLFSGPLPSLDDGQELVDVKVLVDTFNTQPLSTIHQMHSEPIPSTIERERFDLPSGSMRSLSATFELLDNITNMITTKPAPHTDSSHLPSSCNDTIDLLDSILNLPLGSSRSADSSPIPSTSSTPLLPSPTLQSVLLRQQQPESLRPLLGTHVTSKSLLAPLTPDRSRTKNALGESTPRGNNSPMMSHIGSRSSMALSSPSLSSMNLAKPLVVKMNRETATQGREEHVRVCFDEIPGKRLIQRVSIDLTPLEVKTRLLEEIGPEFGSLVDQFELKVLSINATFTNESLPLRRQLVMQACNISRLFPKLQLTLKNADELKLPDTELVDLKGHIQTELEIFELIGKGLARILEAGRPEVVSFRRDLAHFRLTTAANSTSLDDLSQYVYVQGEPLPLIVPPRITILVTIPGTVKISKKIDCEPRHTVAATKLAIFKKYTMVEKIATKDKSADDFVLKVTGQREYILTRAELGHTYTRFYPTGEDGDFSLLDYDYVRQCIARSQTIELTFTNNSIVSGIRDEPVSFIDKLLETTDFDDSDSDNEGSGLESPPTSPAASAILATGTKLPITAVNRLFRVKIVGIRNISLVGSSEVRAKFGDGRQAFTYAMIELYHGGALVATPVYTPIVPIVSTESLYFPDWERDVWTPFNISIRALPKAVRACFTLYVTSEQPSDAPIYELGGKAIPLGWANCQLIDHKGCLRTGPVAFKLWEDDRANPIGTCVDNVAAKTPTVLLVEFETFVKPVVFVQQENLLTKVDSPPKRLDPNDEKRLDSIMRSDPLVELTPEDRKLIYTYRSNYKKKPRSLAKFLASVNWVDPDQTAEAYRLMHEWAPLTPVQALELLDARFADNNVRSFAINTLNSFTDAEFSDYLLQLTQVLKYEPYHKSDLSNILIQRALANRSRIGHPFFWFLKAEMHTPEIEERYGLLLEGYLRSCGSHRQELIKQNEVIKALHSVAMSVKQTHGATERKKVLLEGLTKIKFPDTFQLPLDPRWEAKGLIVDKCRYMDSKKLPLWLVFENVEPHAKPLTVIFKVGDDLRQDILTLQVLRVMDKFWKSGGLDLRLQPYKCVSTGDGIGMLEVVLNANTIANINKDAGGTGALLEEKTLVNWLRECNPNETDFNKAVETFILSCAGYVVATYVMGIGDRHSDNIMITRAGHLFHIDFGHFLGNYKKKYGFKRERAPFIFTPQYMAIVGGKDSENFKFFVKTCCVAYNILRKHTDLFINLFQLMLSTGIPELQCAEDIDYLRKALAPDLTDDEASEEFTKNIQVALNTKTVLLNDIFHGWAH